jgi:hypothetical protein
MSKSQTMTTINMAYKSKPVKRKANGSSNHREKEKKGTKNPNNPNNNNSGSGSEEGRELQAITQGMSKFGFSSRGGFRKNKSKNNKTRKHKSNKKSKKNNKH